MKIDPTDAAFPAVSKRQVKDVIEETNHRGLTIREHFAAMAMEGMLANPERTREAEQVANEFDVKPPEAIARLATRCADALIEALNAEKK